MVDQNPLSQIALFKDMLEHLGIMWSTLYMLTSRKHLSQGSPTLQFHEVVSRHHSPSQTVYDTIPSMYALYILLKHQMAGYEHIHST